MEKQTIYIIASIAIVVLAILWFGYRALKRYSCCGTCGCNLMTKKERKAYEERRASLIESVKQKSEE